MNGLYAITPDWPDTHPLLAVSEHILSAGCGILQYRNKAASRDQRAEQAAALRALTRRYQARLIINDDIDLALSVAADGVHLGAEDGDLAAARARIPATMWLGASCYQSLDRARAARAAGADYIAFGSFYPSLTKPQAGRADTDLLIAAKELGCPVCAIGGITVDNAPPLIAAGADCLAVISALYDAPDPVRATRQFVSLFENMKRLKP